MAFQIKTAQPMFQKDLVEGANPFAVLGKQMSELDNMLETRKAKDWATGQDFTTLEGIKAAGQGDLTKQQQDLLNTKSKGYADLMSLQNVSDTLAYNKEKRPFEIDKLRGEVESMPAEKEYKQKERVAKLGKLEAESEEAKAKAKDLGTFKPSDKQAEKINEVYDAGNAAKQASTKWTSMSTKAAGYKPKSGILGIGEEAIKGIMGTEDEITLFKKEWDGLVNSEAMKLLPPGAASDNDIKMVLKGFPGSNADSAALASFARGMAKLKDYEYKYNNSKAQWLSKNPTLTGSDVDFEINGVKIGKGSSFNDYMKSSYGAKKDEGLEVVETFGDVELLSDGTYREIKGK